MNILITGSAGFIGYHLSKRLINEQYKIIGVDNLNNYYDVGLKKARLNNLLKYDNFKFYQYNIEDNNNIQELFDRYQFDTVIHLAAQAGVRYSLKNPWSYINSNIVGLLSILESCRSHPVKHLIFASSSSVYGANRKIPFSEHDNVDHPVSLYAATKKSGELMAHTYSHLFNIPVTNLRFFTVYGPWGRPDMAYYKFTESIYEGKEIEVYNNGNMRRDFTYIDDVVEAIIKLIYKIPVPNKNWNDKNPDPSSSFAPYKVYNIGNNKPVNLLDFIAVLERIIGKKAKKKFLPMQPGDVIETYADITELEKEVGYRPKTSIVEGLRKFVEWYDWYSRR